MLTVKIEKDYADALNEMGIEAKDGMYVMAMRDKELLMGVGIMSLFDDFASLDSICMKEEFKGFDLEFGMGKSMLNFIDLRGIRYVATNIKNERLTTALRFKPLAESENFDKIQGDWLYCLNLEGYFASNC